MTYSPPPQTPAGDASYGASQPGYQAAPGGYQGGYQPASPGYPSQPVNESRSLSLWGMILGISGLILPLFVNSIAGGVLSGIGLAREPRGKGMAIAGLITSVLGFIWGFIAWPLALVIAAAVVYESGVTMP